MHKLSASFVLAYHGCSKATAESLLAGTPFKVSRNRYDWLGDGVYFWEANPLRGLEFYRKDQIRKGHSGDDAYVVGAVLNLGYCLDLSTSTGVAAAQVSYALLKAKLELLGQPLPKNHGGKDKLFRQLDRDVFNLLHVVREEGKLSPFDTVRGFFTEGDPAYDGAGFLAETHVQIAVRNLDCIKGVFRVPAQDLSPA